MVKTEQQWDRRRSRLYQALLDLPARECWRNAALTLFAMRDSHPQAVYVEGHLTCAQVPIPIEHGWVEVDGLVVDPTLIANRLKYRETHWFPALSFTPQDLLAQMDEDDVALPLVWHGPDLPHDRLLAYSDNYLQALAHLSDLDLEELRAQIDRLHQTAEKGVQEYARPARQAGGRLRSEPG